MKKSIKPLLQYRQLALQAHIFCAALIVCLGLYIFYVQYHQLEINTQKLSQLHSSNAALASENQQLVTLAHQQQNLTDDLNTLTLKIRANTNQKADNLLLLKRLEQQHQLLQTKFSFHDQQRITPNSHIPRQYEVFSTSMHLQAQFLHEEALLNFLTDLRAQAAAIVIPEECNLQLIDTQNDKRHLAVECQIQWVSLEPKLNNAMAYKNQL